MVNLEELDYFDEFEDSEVGQNEMHEEPSNYEADYESNYENSYEESYEDEDVLSAYLRSKGINPDAVKFENEAGETEEVSFNDLPFDEQLQILQYNSLDDNYGLSDEETMFINGLRSNNLSVNDYANYIARTAVQNYIQSNQGGRQYEIDDISDDELFLIDLQASIPDISEEDALSELDTAKNNPDMYSRKINSLRQEYKERENMLLEQEQQEQQYAAQQQAQQFEAAIVNAVNDSEIIDFGDSSIALSVDDKEEIASYILDSDGAGVRYIAKALQDPATLVRMVWYELKGREAFQQISDYYKREIAEASKNNYTKGYEDAKSGRVANSSKSVVRRPATQNKKKPLSIDELD